VKREIKKGLLVLIGISILQAGIWLSYSSFAVTATHAFPALSVEVSKSNTVDPEQQPLSFYEKHHEQARQASGRSLGRLLIGLLGVLALFAFSARWGLPRLMERYPEFFEYCRRHYTAQKEVLNNAKTVEPTEDRDTSGETPSSRWSEDIVASMKLLSSTVLNARQELHLVAIGERQFIIASSPEGISNLGELSASSNKASELKDLFVIPNPISSQIRRIEQASKRVAKEDHQSTIERPTIRIKKETVTQPKPYARPPKPKAKLSVTAQEEKKVRAPQKKDEMLIELLKDYDDIY
jgi:flagellar biogenesis protein FliO